MNSLFATITILCFAGFTVGTISVPAMAGPSRSAAASVPFGIRNVDHGHSEGARQNFGYAVARDGHHLAAACLCRTYCQVGQIDRSHAAWAASAAGDADPQTTYAEKLLERGRSDAAATDALRLGPHECHAQAFLRRVALPAGREDEPNADPTEALRGDRNDAAAWAAWADPDRKRRDNATAITHYQEAVKGDPDHAPFNESLAPALDAAGRSADPAAAQATAASLKTPQPS